MKIYSASEAVWPALERTYSFLFRPFKGETFLKLAAVAAVSEGFIVSYRVAVPNAFPVYLDPGALASFLFDPEFPPVAILWAAAIFLIAIYGYYLVTLLRFAFVHCLIHQTGEIRAAAKLYREEAERYFTASMIVWLAFLVVAVLAFVLYFMAAYGSVGANAQGKPGSLYFAFPSFLSSPIAVVLMLTACVAHIFLNDLILPHMAIEASSFAKAWAAVWAHIAANKVDFLKFFILRLAMPMAAGVLLWFAGWVVGHVVFGLLGISAAGFNAMLEGFSGLRAYIRVAIEWVFVLLGLGAGVVLAISLGGPLGVFTRSYALFFYGGHYKALGNLLEPPRV
jgi:hypothetical protein